MEPLRVGIVGCGNISGIYFKNLSAYTATEIVAVADLDLDRAKAAAAQHGVPNALTPDELIAHADVELVLNLTIPKAHGSVALAAVKSGKHVYNEKPLTVSLEESRELIKIATENKVLVGGAPDTFLGGAHQTARAAIERGDIGEPIGSHAFMLCHGHESWHPSPEFYYEVGGGPMLDMGPYYLTALVNMIGGVQRVSGSTRITFPTRTITSEPKRGKVIEVETPTHIAGIMDFQNGAVGEITTSFDVWHSKVPNILVYGTEGSLHVPDPNGFGGEVFIRTAKMSEWETVKNEHDFNGNARGVGVLDMAVAIRENRPHRAHGNMAAHVLEVMHAFQTSSESNSHVQIHQPMEKPKALAPGELKEYVPAE